MVLADKLGSGEVRFHEINNVYLMSCYSHIVKCHKLCSLVAKNTLIISAIHRKFLHVYVLRLSLSWITLSLHIT